MTPIDILFWLLVVLMGGIAWAIEAGLGYRHRKVLSSSILAALGAGTIIMFWIDDNTTFDRSVTVERAKVKKKAKDQGELPQEDVENEGSTNSKTGEGGLPKAADASSSNAGAKGGAGGKSDEFAIDETKAVYSRTPFRDCAKCPEIVIIPEGSFQMGSPPDEPGRTKDELPPTKADVDAPLAIGRVEVLRADFQAFVEDTKYESTTQCDIGRKSRTRYSWMNPGYEQDERHAVTCLSREDVNRYLAWLSAKSGRTYRLPSEKEWEYAARSQTTTPFWTGDTIWRHQGNFGRSRDGTTVSGSFEMNKFGLSDLAGNLWEMTAECRAGAQGQSEQEPVCERVLKGGGWNAPAAMARHAARLFQSDNIATNFVGIRIVRTIDERDADKLLSKSQRIALLKDEKRAAEIKAKEIEAAEKAKRDAREAAANPPPPAKAAPKTTAFGKK